MVVSFSVESIPINIPRGLFYKKGEHPECYELECDKDLWKVMVEESANNIAVGRTEREKTNEKCLHQSIFDRRYKRQ